MRTVSDILKAKGKGIWSISPHATVFEALKILADKDIGALLVVVEEKLVGIFSERDYARKVILKGKSSKETSVGELMTKEVLYVIPTENIKNCMALMTAKRVRHLPVLENDRVLGIVTIGDVVSQVISEQEFTIQKLEKYIYGEF
jgi:CBS domain-containing protein